MWTGTKLIYNILESTSILSLIQVYGDALCIYVQKIHHVFITTEFLYYIEYVIIMK